MFDKISIANIIKDHVRTLKNNKTKKISYLDIVLFFLLPLTISSFIVYVGMSLNDALVNALITSLSIFSALLFNLLLLVYDISEKNQACLKLQIQSRINAELKLVSYSEKFTSIYLSQY